MQWSGIGEHICPAFRTDKFSSLPTYDNKLLREGADTPGAVLLGAWGPLKPKTDYLFGRSVCHFHCFLSKPGNEDRTINKISLDNLAPDIPLSIFSSTAPL